MKKVSLVLSLVFLSLLIMAGKPIKPPPEPDEVIGIPSISEPSIEIDGDLDDWNLIECKLIDLRWGGKANKEVLSQVCVFHDPVAGVTYVKGLPTGGNRINDKPDSMHLTADKVKAWADTDLFPDGILPEFAKVNPRIEAETGCPIVDGFEAAFTQAPGDYTTIVHISIFPEGRFYPECNGESSRTNRGDIWGIE